MNYSDSFRRGTPSRHYSQRINDNSEIGPSRGYSAAFNYHNSSSRPGPSSVPPRREDSRTEEIAEEEIIIEHARPSVHRASAPRVRINGEPEISRVDSGASGPGPDRRARVEDEPEPSYDDPRPSPHPPRPERHYGLEIEPRASTYDRERARRRYEPADEYETYRHASGRGDVPMVHYIDNRRRSSGIPPPPASARYAPPPMPPPLGYQPVSYAYDRRRTRSGHPGPPPPSATYFRPVVDEERGESRRHKTDHSLPPRLPPPPRLVPPGVVTPSPYLVSSYQNPPNSGSGEGQTGGRGGGGGGKGGHDLSTLAEQPNPKGREKVRNSIVLCVYRNSKKTFDFRFVELRRSPGTKINREERPAVTDLHLFKEMRMTYEKDLRGWIRRIFSFKHLSTVRLLQYGDGLFFRPEQEDDIFSSKFMRIWRNPKEELDGAMDIFEWNRWLFRQKNLEYEFDMAIELIEDYVPERIVLFAGTWLIGIAGLTAAWLIVGGNPGNVSTVMSFVLTFMAALVALTSIWDWFDADRSKEIQQRAVMVLPERYINHEPLPIFDGPGQKVGKKDIS